VHAFRHPIGVAAASLRLVSSPSPDVGPVDAKAKERSELPVGRIVELCGGPSVARTSAAVALCVEAQSQGDPVAWVLARDAPSSLSSSSSSSSAVSHASSTTAGIYPPDLAEAGIDLEALVVVHVPASDVRAGPRAAEILLRTGGFGAVVLDLSSLSFARQGPKADAWMGRLLGLAREHSARLVVLTSSDAAAPSLGPLVSLRLEMRRSRLSRGRFRVEGKVLKDKSGSMKGEEERVMRGPIGMT
jgi:recombination protein RecA